MIGTEKSYDLLLPRARLRSALLLCAATVMITMAETMARPCLGQDRTVEAAWELSATLEKESARAAEPVVIFIILKNISQQPGSFVRSSLLRDYNVSVTNEKGEEMPLTRFGRLEHDAAGGHFRRIVQSIAPGEQVQDRLLVNRLYDMTMEGKYTVRIQRSVVAQHSGKPAWITAKDVTVTIEPNGND